MGDVFRVGDAFEGEWREYTIIATDNNSLADDEVEVETLTGDTQVVGKRELIEMVATRRAPVTN
jgi:hypothetical protein